MSKLGTVLKRILSAFAALCGLTAVFLWRACDNACGNEVRHEVLSPNGTKRAFAYVRGCGATSRDVYWVAILDADEELGNRAGNVFAIEPPYGRKLDPLGVVWTSADRLQVSYPARSTVFRRFEQVEGVHVLFVEETAQPSAR